MCEEDSKFFGDFFLKDSFVILFDCKKTLETQKLRTKLQQNFFKWQEGQFITDWWPDTYGYKYVIMHCNLSGGRYKCAQSCDDSLEVKIRIKTYKEHEKETFLANDVLDFFVKLENEKRKNPDYFPF